MYYVYILKLNTKKIYIGYTSDLSVRLKRHNQILPSKKSSFTYKNHGIWKVVYKEIFNSKEKAQDREKELKTSRGREFIHNFLNGRSVN